MEGACIRIVYDSPVILIHYYESITHKPDSDRLSTRILSACCKMTDIMQERITLIEDLTKKRQPITNMEAIYFITPSEDSIARVLSDFADPARPQYKGIENSKARVGARIQEPEPVGSRTAPGPENF